jgi:hypothetical protein
MRTMLASTTPAGAATGALAAPRPSLVLITRRRRRAASSSSSPSPAAGAGVVARSAAADRPSPPPPVPLPTEPLSPLATSTSGGSLTSSMADDDGFAQLDETPPGAALLAWLERNGAPQHTIELCPCPDAASFFPAPAPAPAPSAAAAASAAASPSSSSPSGPPAQQESGSSTTSTTTTSSTPPSLLRLPPSSSSASAAAAAADVAVAAVALAPGDLALSVPERLVLTLGSVVGSDDLAEKLTSGKLSELSILSLVLAYEKKSGKKSRWFPFIKELDRQRARSAAAGGSESPLLWGIGETRRLLQGSPVVGAVEARLEGIRDEYEQLDTVWFMVSIIFESFCFVFLFCFCFVSLSRRRRAEKKNARSRSHKKKPLSLPFANTNDAKNKTQTNSGERPLQPLPLRHALRVLALPHLFVRFLCRASGDRSLAGRCPFPPIRPRASRAPAPDLFLVLPRHVCL